MSGDMFETVLESLVDDGIFVRTGELNALGNPIYTLAPEYQGMDERTLMAAIDATDRGEN